MKALVLKNNRVTFRSDYPQPEPGLGEVLIRVTLTGICSTDLEIVKGYGAFQGVLGHEFVGVVEALGPGAEGDWLDKRVVGTINVGCEQCDVCHSAGSEHCPKRTVIGIIGRDGIFAEYVALPAANLLEVPENVTDEAAVFTEPLAAALRVRDQIRVRPSKKVAVGWPRTPRTAYWTGLGLGWYRSDSAGAANAISGPASCSGIKDRPGGPAS